MGLDGIMVDHMHIAQTQTQYKQMCMHRPHTQEEDSERVILIVGTQTHIATQTETYKHTVTIATYLGYLR